MKHLLLLPILFIYFVVSFAQRPVNQMDKVLEKQIKKANEIFDKENYSAAIPLFAELVSKSPENADLNFKLGFCYLKTPLDKEKSIRYLTASVQGIKADKENKFETPLTEAMFYLASAYHRIYRFEDARKIFSDLKTNYSKDLKNNMEDLVDLNLRYCDNGVEIMKDAKEKTVENFGNLINCSFSDHSPIVSTDETILIFTSRRKKFGSKKSYDGQYDEDIYMSTKDFGMWQEPVGISTKINTKGHDAACSLSPDGMKLFFYRDGDLFSSKRTGTEWSKPTAFEYPINSKARETHVSITTDGKRIYFTSDRKGTLGGLDIWTAEKLRDGKWGNITNMGSTINTPYNEECPFIHPDGTTLYFNSEGHKSMGGYDLFTSALKDSIWQVPVNMGYPLSTTENDVFFGISVDASKGYYSSQQSGGAGDRDLYIIHLPDNKNLTVVNGKVFTENGKTPEGIKITVTNTDEEFIVNQYTPNTETGDYLFILPYESNYFFVYDAPGFLPEIVEFPMVEMSVNSKITRKVNITPVVKDNTEKVYRFNYFYGDKDTTVGKDTEILLRNLSSFMVDNQNLVMDLTISNKLDTTVFKKRMEKLKEYAISQGVKENRISYQLTYLPYKTDTVYLAILDTISREKYKKKQKDFIAKLRRDSMLAEDNKKVKKDTQVVIVEKKKEQLVISNIMFDLNKYTVVEYENLNKLADFLKANPSAKIEIAGYTDLQGNATYNKKLSEKRAKTVRDYLVTKGVNESQFVAGGYGYNNPIAKNKKGSKFYWDALKYNRRVEFKVLNQGENSELVVQQIEVPVEFLEGKQIIFVIVISEAPAQQDVKNFKDIQNIKEFKTNDGTYKYYFGSFSSSDDAEQARKKIVSKYPNSVIILYDDLK